MAELLNAQEALDRLEANSPYFNTPTSIALSQAISLKRIADALELINQREEMRYSYEHKG